MEDLKEFTPEQIKEVSEILSKARRSMLWISIKFVLGLFVANFISILVGELFLVGTETSVILGYQALCVCMNAVFMSRYFSSRMNKSSDIVKAQIKEILNK